MRTPPDSGDQASGRGAMCGVTFGAASGQEPFSPSDPTARLRRRLPTRRSRIGVRRSANPHATAPA
jgi:hypothetical protein